MKRRGRLQRSSVPAGFRAVDFFAGSGLVRLGLAPGFQTVWANDFDPKKATVYRANGGGEHLVVGSIEDVKGRDVPQADLAWASFPCQDLSLAGNLKGIHHGTRSALFWEWIRVLDEMQEEGKRPPLLVAENVVGFLSSADGANLKAAYEALRQRKYRVGAVVLDARDFVPQSRPRAFLIAVAESIDLDGLTRGAPVGPFHTKPVMRAADATGDSEWVWWALPSPSHRVKTFAEFCERHAPAEKASGKMLALLSPRNREKLRRAKETGLFLAGTGYKRTRPNEEGESEQRLELRFDGIAGCLRTPEGGSSRQIVLLVDEGEVRFRLMTVRECARLMGAPDSFKVPGTYNDGYRAMGDAVAVPVTRWLSRHLLEPLAERSHRLAVAS